MKDTSSMSNDILQSLLNNGVAIGLLLLLAWAGRDAALWLAPLLERLVEAHIENSTAVRESIERVHVDLVDIRITIADLYGRLDRGRERSVGDTERR